MESTIDQPRQGVAPDETNTNSGAPQHVRINPLSFKDLLYAKQKMGCVINLQTPIEGTGQAIFAIKMQPQIPTGLNDSTPFSNLPNAWARKAKAHPVFLFQSAVRSPDLLRTPTGYAKPPLRGMCVFQYEQEPLASRVSRLAGGYQGGINYFIRTVVKMTDQGNITVSRLDGLTLRKTIVEDYPPLWGEPSPLVNFQDFEINGTVEIDLTDKKHINAAFPYFRQHMFTSTIYDFADTDQFLVFRVDGTTLTGDDKLIQFILEYQLDPAFKFLKPLFPFVHDPDNFAGVYFHPFWASGNETYAFGDYNLAPTTMFRYRSDNTADTWYLEDGEVTNRRGLLLAYYGPPPSDKKDDDKRSRLSKLADMLAQVESVTTTTQSMKLIGPDLTDSAVPNSELDTVWEGDANHKRVYDNYLAAISGVNSHSA